MEARRCLSLYTGLFGNPPRRTRTYRVVVLPPGYGGQSDVGGVLLDGSALSSPEKAATSLYHEVAHMWSIPSREKRPSRLLDEGLASFMQLLAEAKLRGRRLEDSINALKTRLREALRANTLLRETPPEKYGERGLQDYSYIVGPLILYRVYSEVGEEAFAEAIGKLLERRGNTGISLNGLCEVFEEVSPRGRAAALCRELLETTLIYR